MTPQEAYQTLRKRMKIYVDDPIAVAAWEALDKALSGDGELPEAWQRLNQSAAGDRAGKTGPHWATLVSKGYAPPRDGTDAAGRAWWHPATVDAWRTGEWVKP